MSMLPPGLILLLGGLLLLGLRAGPARHGAVILLPALTLFAIWQVPDGVALSLPFLDYTLTPVVGDKVGRLFATAFALIALLGGLFAFQQQRSAELAAAFVYAGSAICVALAGDLITVFVFWEIMAIGSLIVVAFGGGRAAYRAAMRYAYLHFFGGVVLMAGIAGHVAATGSVAFTAMELTSLPAWLILIGFLLNAGAPPFWSWVGDAYPEASWSGTVFLSAFTTKTAVLVLWRGFPGTELLIVLGLAMVLYGIFWALLENDARRILSYSIVNQVGFMVTGIGIGGELALNGVASHAFAHIIYKGLLLMTAGAVLYQTGKRKCTELGGLWQSMPITTVCAIIGALSISAFPLTSGFVSKSMINDAAAYAHLAVPWFILTAATAGVFLHAGIKFPWFVFFQRDSGLRPRDPHWSMVAAMVLMAVLCIGIGSFPAPFYALLPFPVEYVPYTAAHVVKLLQLLLFSGLAFFLLLPLMKRTETISLDIDWLYRVLAPAIIRPAGGALVAIWRGLERAVAGLLDAGGRVLLGLAGEGAPLAATLRSSTMLAFITAGLALALLLSLILPALFG